MKLPISVLLLLAFLFPSVVIELHSRHHQEQAVCDSGANHFHEHHNECHFCDLLLPFSAEPSKAQADIFAPQFAEYLFPYLVENYFSSFDFFSAQLRAPPVSA